MTMILKIGATGREVSKLKAKLIRLGYDLDDTGLNKGAFGPKVDSFVRDFQKKNNLTVDGEVGPLTNLALDYAIALLDGYEVPSDGPPPIYWKPGPYHPMFVVPKGYTHLHPWDILYSIRGEKEIYGSKDNMMIAHMHEHSGNLGLHSEGADYHDEVPHCMSAWNWACDGAGCYKTDNALASSGLGYPEKFGAKTYKKGDMVPQGAAIVLDGHITSANRAFRFTGTGSFEGFGSNQGDTIKTSTFSQARIKVIFDWVPKPGTRLAPISGRPVPSTGNGTESTR